MHNTDTDLACRFLASDHEELLCILELTCDCGKDDGVTSKSRCGESVVAIGDGPIYIAAQGRASDIDLERIGPSVLEKIGDPGGMGGGRR